MSRAKTKQYRLSRAHSHETAFSVGDSDADSRNMKLDTWKFRILEKFQTEVIIHHIVGKSWKSESEKLMKK